ncbi:hypothetical protein BJ508DRAFT_415438 [Ascobolus immersus RN42]|uniref:Uncharacterized protein n=1 Tax=Ascobolus immersus RN42 TaxID=1160509 RepID=A0A3N4I4X6_ASCIM|nr:hypothetical protein BJ508DRAFT_415438 [Ascobolus immersus RN42]
MSTTVASTIPLTHEVVPTSTPPTSSSQPRPTLPSTPYPRNHPKHRSLPPPTTLPTLPVNPNHVFILNPHSTNRMSRLKLRMSHLPDSIEDFEAIPPPTPPPVPRFVIPFDRPVTLRQSMGKVQQQNSTNPAEMSRSSQMMVVYPATTEAKLGVESSSEPASQLTPTSPPQLPLLPVMYLQEAEAYRSTNRGISQAIQSQPLSPPASPARRPKSDYQPARNPSPNQTARLSLREEFDRTLILPSQLFPAQTSERPKLAVQTQFKQVRAEKPRLVDVKHSPSKRLKPASTEKQPLQRTPITDFESTLQSSKSKELDGALLSEKQTEYNAKPFDGILSPLTKSVSLPTPPPSPSLSKPTKKPCKLRQLFKKAGKKQEPGSRAIPWYEPLESEKDLDLEDARKGRRRIDKATVGLNGAGLFFGAVVRTVQHL